MDTRLSTMPLQFLALHGLAVRKSGSPASVADLLGLPVRETEPALSEAVVTGEAMEARGTYMVTPVGQAALTEGYPIHCAVLREDHGLGGLYGRFERLNSLFLNLMTDWQTIPVGGERVPNDHSDRAYDAKILDRLDSLHERASTLLEGMAEFEGRLKRYADRLTHAHEQTCEGNYEYFSSPKIPSYHTVWFELHEDLLRLLGAERQHP